LPLLERLLRLPLEITAIKKRFRHFQKIAGTSFEVGPNNSLIETRSSGVRGAALGKVGVREAIPAALAPLETKTPIRA
jgi:hypothetical protein